MRLGLLDGPVMLQCTAGCVDDRTNHIGIEPVQEHAASLHIMQCTSCNACSSTRTCNFAVEGEAMGHMHVAAVVRN